MEVPQTCNPSENENTKLSKKELNKLKAKEKKAAAMKLKQPQGGSTPTLDISKYAHLFGFSSSFSSSLSSSSLSGPTKYVHLDSLNAKMSNTQVWVRGRIHRIRKAGSSLCFIILRQRWATVQLLIEATPESSPGIQPIDNDTNIVPQVMVNWVSKIKPESIVDIYAHISLAKDAIESCSQHDIELKAIKVFIVSMASDTLPLRVQDCSIPDTIIESQRQEISLLESKIVEIQQILANLPNDIDRDALKDEIQGLIDAKSRALKYGDPDMSTRLDHRVIDLRTMTNQCIFVIQMAIVTFFRDYLTRHHFTEIHSPKLVGSASEGGAEVFAVQYFDRKAYLAQSPQFYKQMAICADFERVFEIGPVFRAELSDTPRHMTEFTGLDLEMQIMEDYHEVVDLIGDMFISIFERLEKEYQKELDIIRAQHPFMPFKFLPKTLCLKFSEGISLLRESGVTIGDMDDLNTAQERQLGSIVRQKFNTDFFILDKFPSAIRPFYTMPDPENVNLSNGYDIFIRGEEICSGAQRIHDPIRLTERAKEKGVDPATIKGYIDAFRYGAPPHGGGGVGLERVVMLYLGLKNIRKTAFFPRDPYRLEP